MTAWPVTPIQPLHEVISEGLMMKETDLVRLYLELRNHILTLAPDCKELVYNTHALTSVFSHSRKLSHAFCHIPIYNHHLNLGFNKGALLDDPGHQLTGTGKLIRHIPVKSNADFDNPYVRQLIVASIELSKPDQG